MLEKMINEIKNKGYVYSLINLHRVDIDFMDFTVCIMILDNSYKVYIYYKPHINKNIDCKEYKYPKNVINYILKTWEIISL